MRLHVCAATLKGERAASAPSLPPALPHRTCPRSPRPLRPRGTAVPSGKPTGPPELNKNPVEGFSAGLIDDNDLYRWEVLIIGPPDTLYEGGVFKAHLTFPKDYPLRPPKMKFITEIWHPNVDKNGDVCISILHEPGEDKYGYEKPEERWLPIHTVETIMISVISMLADPNGDSPANVDAAKEWREDRNGEFKRKVARCVRKSQETAFE
ncbi:ubiquitin-conjugating enzyme E2 G1 isoform X2 [Manacus candei]|uniref:ubiquitin-conjugating enzyme E2 G1 isoform X2 n=1 Tax=Manacus candei TaxID=415023 RepID=UPI002226B08A|nr:ubiquitin-conjugating enzyme E2 G1 isoform X2 [Manacus candei]